MPIQPFATQIQPPQIQPVNAMAQVGQLMAMRNAQQENALRDLQMGQLKQGIEQENALREYLRGADLSTSEARKGLVRYGTPGLEAQRALQQAEAASLQTASAQQQLITDRLKSFKEIQKSALTPEDRLAFHDAVHADAVLGPYLESMGATADRGRAQILEAAKTPDSWQSFLVQSDLGLDKLIDLGIRQQQERRADSAEERAKRQERRTEQEFQRRVAAEDLGTYNADAGGFISSTTNKFTPLRQVQETKEAASARKALTQIGYDPNTASDTVTDLIKNSTGSLAGTWVDSLARSVGMGTAGAQNIESLAAIANQMALDLAGGKLGAGFSNEDRDFLKGTLGDVANPRKTRSERLAAWNVAKNRLKNLAGETKPAARGAGASGSWDAPSKVDPEEWKFLTPEEKALWQK